MASIKRYLWLSQAALFGGLCICSLLLPSVVRENGGVSNFGNHLLTVVPYALGFLANMVYLALAARQLRQQAARRQRFIGNGLLVICLLELLVLASTFPRHFSFTFSDIHDDLGIALFAYEFVGSVWLVVRQPSWLSASLLTLEAAGSLVGLLSILKVLHFLYIGQLAGALGVGLLLVLVLPQAIVSSLSGDQRHLRDQT